MGKIGDTDMKVARSRGEIVPRDFAAAVKDIKLAILQSRARAAHASNVEALKLYFYVGGYVSKKTRTAKWGSGAIDALSNRLQVELPGLRGFSASNIKYMRIFFEAWTKPKFGSRGFRYCRIANEPVAFPVTGFVRSET